MKTKCIVTILAALMALGILSSTASATTTTESARAHSQVTSVVFKVVKAKGWTGVQEHIRIQHVPKSACHWYAWGWNSDYLVGQISYKPQMYKDYHLYLCPDKYSPTGWVKRGGGHTGSDCGNIAAPPFVKPKYPVVKPPVLEVKSFSALKLKVKVEVKASASLTLSCGTATGSGVAFDLIQVRARTYIKAEHTQGLKLKLAAKAVAKAKDRAEATAELQCSGSPKEPEPKEPEEPPKGPPTCNKEPKQEKCAPTVFLEEEINDMEASANGHHHKRYICFHAYPGAESTSSDLEVTLKVRYGNVLSKYAEFKGANEYCQWYETSSEPVTEEMWGWARDKNTGAIGESTRIYFPVEEETPF